MHVALLALLVSAAPAQADDAACTAPTSTGDVLAAMELAEAAYADADLAALQAAEQRALSTLPCVQETVSRTLVARFHRTMGLAAFVRAETERSERAFAAARRIEPGYSFPAEVVPPGNPVLDHYQALSIDRPLTTPLDPRPADGRLLLDGRAATTRSASWPVIAQVLDDRGSVQTTAWIWPDQDLPAYPRSSPGTTAASSSLASSQDRAEPPSAGRGRERLPWIIGTAAAAATSATLFAVSRGAASTYRDPATTGQDELASLRSTANGTLYASAGAAAVTVALGAVTLTF